MIKRAKERYERELSGPSESRRKSRSGADSITPGCSHLTRSQTSSLNKAACFFVMVKIVPISQLQAAYKEILTGKQRRQ